MEQDHGGALAGLGDEDPTTPDLDGALGADGVVAVIVGPLDRNVSDDIIKNATAIVKRFLIDLSKKRAEGRRR
ncbi:hypothetical protein [Tsukamurella sp. PLM1]|uniref:hypothetical protein n=1 Tax=Tsukamurella sp. PLM1 TaxID=2929795 RepID=UPI0020C0CE5F|nr:hypothetical protein [Tsukamurella sp. PLM1]